MRLHLTYLINTAILFLLLSGSLSAQNTWQKFRGNINNSLSENPSFLFSLDSRRSFIARQDVKIFGFRMGANFNNRVRLGYGLYGLSSPFYKNFVVKNDSTGQDEIVNAKLKFVYVSYFFEYVFLRTKRWEFSVPLHIGLGRTEFEGLEGDTGGGVLIGGLAVQGHFKIFPWLGLGGGAGYRHFLIPNPLVKEDFNNPIYTFYVKLFLGEIYRMVFPKKEMEDQDS